MTDGSVRDARLVFVAALATRLLGVAVTTLTSLNTYSHADADDFARSADRIASAIEAVTLPVFNPDNIFHLWGGMLSPFWLLPGPNRVYARIGMAILGAVAVYNVYVIARHYHSRQAGIIAVVPLLIYPSMLFLHSTVLREAVVLFGLTTVARLLLAPSPRLDWRWKYATAGVLLVVVTSVREENLPVYLLVLAVGGVVALKPWRRYRHLTRYGTAVGLLFGAAGALVYADDILTDLMILRRSRARGRTEYLGWVFPDTLPAAIAFSWIGAFYFLFTPFPWMVTRLIDAVAMMEGLTNIAYAIAAFAGARMLAARTLAGAVALVVGIVVGSLLYGLGTANVGTAVRHRPMVMWAIYLLGGIGVATYVRFTIGGDES